MNKPKANWRRVLRSLILSILFGSYYISGDELEEGLGEIGGLGSGLGGNFVEYKPGSSSLNPLDECTEESELVWMSAAVQEQLKNIQNQFHNTNVLSHCSAGPQEYSCVVDYAKFDNTLSGICESSSMNGLYLEKEHKIVCKTTQQNRDTTIRVVNYPLCFSKSCNDAEIERMVAEDVHQLERDLSESLDALCTSEYDINDGICLSSINASPSTCGPLMSSTKDQHCECYSFCDGKLAGCNSNDEDPMTSSIIQNCAEKDLVTGCNYILFGLYENSTASSRYQLIGTVLPLVASIALFLLGTL